MRFLGEMIDQKIKKPYSLYSINAKVLQTLLKETYMKKMTELDIHLFNSELDYYKHVRFHKKLIRLREKGVNYQQYGRELEVQKDIDKAIEAIRGNAHDTFKLQTVNSMGYELMPLAISVKNRNLENAESIELLDGFRRMFFTPNVPDSDVLLKVYDEVDDVEWINLMLVFNSWKFATGHSASFYLDRGFRLGLYHRYNIDFTNFYNRYDSSDVAEIDMYTAKMPFSTMWNNHYFQQDITFIYRLIEHFPTFKLVKKRSEEVYDTKTEYDYPYFLSKINHLIIKLVGQIRRKEFAVESKGLEVKRKPLDEEQILSLFQSEDLQAHFIKLSKMTVPGFMDNYINSHMDDFITSYIFNHYFGDEKGKFIQDIKYLPNVVSSRKLFSNYELKKQLSDNNLVYTTYRDKELLFKVENNKFILSIADIPEQTFNRKENANHSFDTFDEMMEFTFDGRSLQDIASNYELKLELIL